MQKSIPTLFFLYLFSLLPQGTAQSLNNPILFCTQVPNPFDFTTLMSTFGNHMAGMNHAPRGGDLYIRYPDGTLKNLTQLAGFGENDHQGANAISVRDPHVHWDGQKALFSMVIGAPTRQYEVNTYYWQIYEITGLGLNDTPVITKVANQPVDFNNIAPIYGTDDRIIFESDRPRNGARHLYPQHDEYESTPIVTGLWRINPLACPGDNSLEMLTTSPSGDFTPIIDSYGRIIFTRWDHLKRDQQADLDIVNNAPINGIFNYTDESADAAKYIGDIEVFPEPLPPRTDLFALPEWQNTNPQNVNLFNPWMINEDGKEIETLNHIGRHELHSFFPLNFTNDPNLTDFVGLDTRIRNMLHIKESPVQPGLYIATDPPEFATHSSGMIISIYLPAHESPDSAVLTLLTHPDTRNFTDNPSPNHTGLYRNPTPLQDGQIIVSHTPETRQDRNEGTNGALVSRYDFRLRLLEQNGAYREATTALTNGINKSVSWWSPDFLQTFNGELWETFPVEVVARPRPIASTLKTVEVPAIEQAIFANAGIDISAFQRFLKRNDLALLVTRNVTSRDDQDKQQPYNLKIKDSNTQTIDPNNPSNIYEVEYLQYLQGDQIRGKGGINNPRAGRRVLAQFMHDTTALAYNLPTTGPEGSINLAADGSVVSLVPANRAMTWQLIDSTDKPIVRERVWLSFQAGEIRVCSSCHGENDFNQAGQPSPTNPPLALTSLLNHLKTIDTDSDNTIDLYDAYPRDNSKQMGEALSEDFVNQLAEWVNQNADEDVTWETTTVPCKDEVAVFNNQAATNGTTDQLSHYIDLGAFEHAQLTFDVAYAQPDANSSDVLRVKVMPCSNQPIATIYEKALNDLATVPTQASLFTPTDCSQWRTETIDLSDYAGQSFDLVFENSSAGGNQLFLDNIMITEQMGSGTTCNIIQMDIINNPNDQTVLTARDYLNSTATILATRKVVFKAGHTITLKPGFHATATSDFLAKIETCTVAPLTTPTPEANLPVQKVAINQPSLVIEKNIALKAYPNPFNTQTTIEYELPEDGQTSITLMDLMGRPIQTLMHRQLQSKGNHQVVFYPDNMKNGTYFVVLQSGAQVLTKRLVFIR